ncbi:MAG: hypothetical protein QXY70_02405 [Nanopusillaceae archaeon]
MNQNYREIIKLTSELFSYLSENRRKSLVFQLLNYLKAYKFERVNNEILKILNTLEASKNEKEKLIEKWQEIYCNSTTKELEKLYYCFIMGILKTNKS